MCRFLARFDEDDEEEDGEDGEDGDGQCAISRQGGRESKRENVDDKYRDDLSTSERVLQIGTICHHDHRRKRTKTMPPFSSHIFVPCLRSLLFDIVSSMKTMILHS